MPESCLRAKEHLRQGLVNDVIMVLLLAKVLGALMQNNRIHRERGNKKKIKKKERKKQELAKLDSFLASNLRMI